MAYTPPPGCKVGLAFTGPYAVPPGYRVGLEFAARPRPEPEPLQLGGTLPLAVPAFSGTVAARHFDRYQTAAGGALPLAVPAFGGAVTARHFDRYQAAAGGTLPVPVLGFSGGVTAPYDSRVQRPLARFAQGEVFYQAARLSAQPLVSGFDDARRTPVRVQDAAQQAQPLAAQVQGVSQQALGLHAQVQDAAQQAQPLRQGSRSAFQSAQGMHHRLRDTAQQALRLQVSALRYAWQIADPRRAVLLARFEQAGIQRGMGLRVPPVLPIGLPGWAIALEFAPEFIAPRTWSELQTGPLVSGAALAQRLQNATAVLRYQDDMRPLPALRKEAWPPAGGEPEDPTDPPRRTIVITAQRAYIVQNQITITRIGHGRRTAGAQL